MSKAGLNARKEEIESYSSIDTISGRFNQFVKFSKEQLGIKNMRRLELTHVQKYAQFLKACVEAGRFKPTTALTSPTATWGEPVVMPPRPLPWLPALALCLLPALCWGWPPTEAEFRAWCRSLQWESCEETRQMLAQPDGTVALWLGRPTGYGYTPLCICARKGNLSLLSLLLLRVTPGGHGAVVNAADDTGNTPLHWASVNGHLAMAQCLLAHGALVNAANDMGNTPLHRASTNGHLAVAQCLLAHGALVDATSDMGHTPLRWASANGHLPVAQCLLVHGAVVNATSNMGYTPLHGASVNGHLEMAQCLLVHGALTTAVNSHGITPLRLASAVNRQAVVSLLAHPPEPDFTPPSLRHLASLSIWHAVGRHIDRLRALFDGTLPPALLTVILVELGIG